MKKIWMTFTAIVLCFGMLAGCGSKGETSSNSGVAMKDGETIQTVIDRIIGEVGIQMPAEIDDATLKDIFFIDPETDAEEYYGQMAMVMNSADNILGVKAKPERKDAVVEALNNRLKNVQDSFAQYLPDQSEKAQKGRVVEKGDYVFLLILGQDYDTFDTDMETAIKIIDEAFA